MSDDIPGFEPDPELEELLEKDIQDVPEDKRIDVQKYRSRKMKARKKAREQGDLADEADSSAPDDESASGEDAEKSSDESEDSSQSEATEIDFDEDPELEELLDEDIMDLDKETRIKVQKYKSQKMKAKRKASENDGGDEPSGSAKKETTGGDEAGPDTPVKAPPADDQKRHEGERKIKELVESRKTGRDVSRRGFLSAFGVGVAGFLGVLGLGGTATGRYFFPNVLENPPEQFEAGVPGDYPTNTVSDKFKGQYRVWIVNLGDRLVAIDAICTHLGCTPNWLDNQGIFKCPCHGSGYYMDGVNFEGPAPRPMDRVGIRLSPTGRIIVDKSMKFSSQASPGWDAKDAFIPV